MVALPPKLAQKISAIITGIGLNLSVLASLIVTAARNKITVIESMNIARTDDKTINATNILTGS